MPVLYTGQRANGLTDSVRTEFMLAAAKAESKPKKAHHAFATHLTDDLNLPSKTFIYGTVTFYPLYWSFIVQK